MRHFISVDVRSCSFISFCRNQLANQLKLSPPWFSKCFTNADRPIIERPVLVDFKSCFPERNLAMIYIGHRGHRIQSRGSSDHQGIPSSQAPHRQVEVGWTIDHGKLFFSFVSSRFTKEVLVRMLRRSSEGGRMPSTALSTKVARSLEGILCTAA